MFVVGASFLLNGMIKFIQDLREIIRKGSGKRDNN